MSKVRLLLSGVLTAVLFAGCASLSPTGESRGGLVGAWIVTASHPAGVGKNLLTFSSDGTFFRSGDTHPVLSGAHGAWKRVGDREFDATYRVPIRSKRKVDRKHPDSDTHCCWPWRQ